MRPNLDIKSNIVGLEKTLDMMIETTTKSPQCFLQAFMPLRIPMAVREVFNEAVRQAQRPSKLAYVYLFLFIFFTLVIYFVYSNLVFLPACRFGMMITSLNVINVFTDEFDQVKADGKLVKLSV